MKVSYTVILFLFMQCNGTHSGEVVGAISPSIPNASHAANNGVITLVSTVDSSLKFYFIDVKGLGGKPLFVPPNGRLTIQCSAPIYLMEPTLNQTGYYIYPKDSIFITKNISGNLDFTTRDSNKNNELHFFSDLTAATGSLRNLARSTYFTQPVEMKHRDEEITKKYYDRSHFLKEYSNHHELSESFIRYAEDAFYYCKIYEKLNLFYPGFERKKIKSFYKDSIEHYVESFNNAAVNNNPFYLDALIAIARFFGQEQNFSTPYVSLEGLPGKSIIKLYNDSRNIFKDEAREYVLAKLLFDMVLHRLANEDSLKSLITSVRNENYRNILLAKLQSLNRTISTDPISRQKFFRSDSSSITWSDLMENSHGKVIYIDIWATWCAPCIEEIPYSRRLQKQYLGKIDFVFISLDDDFQKWKQDRSLNLNSSNSSYWADGSFSSALARELKISSIPRYIIIDKSGKITNKDALRPSDPNLIALLNNYEQK